MRAPARCSFPPGTRRSACRGPGTSNGRCACSRSAPSRRTCWTIDVFDGSKVIEEKVAQLVEQIRTEMARIAALGGTGTQQALEYMKERLVASNAARVEAIERGDEIRVGVNAYRETEVSPLTAGNGHFLTVDETAEAGQIARLKQWRAARDDRKVAAALSALERAAKEDVNLMPVSIDCARAGVTTGEWARALRKVFGEYRAPTGVAATGRRETTSGSASSRRKWRPRPPSSAVR